LKNEQHSKKTMPLKVMRNEDVYHPKTLPY